MTFSFMVVLYFVMLASKSSYSLLHTALFNVNCQSTQATIYHYISEPTPKLSQNDIKVIAGEQKLTIEPGIFTGNINLQRITEHLLPFQTFLNFHIKKDQRIHTPIFLYISKEIHDLPQYNIDRLVLYVRKAIESWGYFQAAQERFQILYETHTTTDTLSTLTSALKALPMPLQFRREEIRFGEPFYNNSHTSIIYLIPNLALLTLSTILTTLFFVLLLRRASAEALCTFTIGMKSSFSPKLSLEGDYLTQEQNIGVFSAEERVDPGSGGNYCIPMIMTNSTC